MLGHGWRKRREQEKSCERSGIQPGKAEGRERGLEAESGGEERKLLNEAESEKAAEEAQSRNRKRRGNRKLFKQSGRERRSEDGDRICQTRLIEIQFPVVMARGIHLFPYRTQKLSLSALMVLGWKRPGRVGRRRIPIKVLVERLTPFLYSAGETVAALTVQAIS